MVQRQRQQAERIRPELIASSAANQPWAGSWCTWGRGGGQGGGGGAQTVGVVEVEQAGARAASEELPA